ncbi:hypothetical protein [Providencia manganoxydans]|uniref:hypothetical protein n=1 Tax=Providencia manganoxydans TaxID=2923283 RepID=UPI0034E4E506
MKNPKLITKPFAQNGQKNAIPENYSSSMESNQATWDQGFGQITMIPVAAGGLPPKGQDFNGIFNQISENVVYLSKGGRFKFSADYAAAINGYPKGAILQSDDEKKEYQSIIDNNKVNFNTATQAQINAAWKLISTDDMLLQIAGKQPAGDYATKTDLSNGLAGRQPAGDYATNAALSNGLGLKFDKTSVVQSTGTSAAQVMSQDALTKALLSKLNTSGGNLSGAVNFSTNSPENYDFISMPGGTQEKNYIRKIRSNTDAAIWHETLVGSTYCLSTGAQDSYPALILGQGDGLWVSKKVTPADYSNFDERYQRSATLLQSSGQSTTGAMSQKAVTDIAFGVGQTWRDVTSERTKGTTYTNTRNKAMMISIAGSGTSPVITVNGVVVKKNIEGHDYATVIIPAGATYVVNASGNILHWAELM